MSFSIHRPPALPIAGHLPAFLAGKLAFLDRASQCASPVVELRLPTRVYLLRQPADVRHVLVSNATNYDKSRRLTGRRGRRISGDGLLTTSGPDHARRRSMLAPSFQASTVGPLLNVTSSLVDQMVASWPEGSEIDIGAELSVLAQHVVIAVIFGSLTSEERNTLTVGSARRRRFLDHVFRSLLPVAEYLPTAVVRDYRRSRPGIDDILQAAIDSRRAVPGTDLVSSFLDACGDDGTPLSDSAVRSEVMTLLVTGYETVGAALTWTWLELARHPRLAGTLAEEVEAELAGRPPFPEDVGRLTYTGLVLAESLRLHPPTWIYVRMARGHDRLPSGLDVRPRSKLYICPWVLHRDPAYFPDPDRFDPERFRPGLHHEPFSYLPFGAGPRVCIGRAMARTEATIVIARLAQIARFAVAAGQEVGHSPGITLEVHPGLRAIVRRRTPR